MSKEAELGILVVVVLKARNLNDKHSFYKQDVFAQATLNGVTKKTPVEIKGGQHPMWDAELRFPILKQVTEKSRKLEVACFAQERKSDDLLGKGTVDISETLKTGEFDEWVSLDVDGVVRGDVYLEMTYYSHTPVPAGAANLSVPAAGITRRPSKLTPAARLSRHPQVQSLSSTQQTDNKKHQGQQVTSPSVEGRYQAPVPSSSRPSSATSPKRADSPLPPVPQESPMSAPLPNALLPGGVRPKKHGTPLSLQQVLSDPYATPPQNLPTTLRPGMQTGNRVPSSGSNIHSRTPSTSLSHAPPVVPVYGYPGPGPNLSTYSPSLSLGPTPPSLSQLPNASATSAPLTVPYPSPPPGSAPPMWVADNSSRPITFPIAATPTPPEAPGSYISPQRPVVQQPTTNNLPDPYLQARYQTPLPLPPGHSDSLPRPHGRQPSPHPSPDNDRIQAIRLAEEEAARRKEQADKDLELALQLDRELNVSA